MNMQVWIATQLIPDHDAVVLVEHVGSMLVLWLTLVCIPIHFRQQLPCCHGQNSSRVYRELLPVIEGIKAIQIQLMLILFEDFTALRTELILELDVKLLFATWALQVASNLCQLPVLA
jgi:hypothetical protein